MTGVWRKRTCWYLGGATGGETRPSTSLSTCAPARLGSKLDLESITPGAFSLLFDLNILSPPASQPPASLLAVYPFPGSSLTPHSSSGARSSLEKSLISRPGGRMLHRPASPPLTPQHILLLGSASPIIVPSASPPVKPQGPEKSLLASLLTQVLRVLQADVLHFGTDKPHKWTHLCPECQPPLSLHVSLLTSATRSSLAPLSVCECERACYLREAA